MKIDELIKSHYRNLNETEKEIFKYMLSQSSQLKEMNIKMIAQATYAHPNTILRMAKKLGCSGFSELKHMILYSFDTPKNAMEKRENQLYQDITQTLSLIHHDVLETIAHLIVEKKKLSIFGLGFSRLCADNFASRLSFLGITTVTFIDQHAMFFYASKLDCEDICLSISYSGEQKGIITPTLLAKSKNATVITLTGLSDNELSRIANYSLFFKSMKIDVEGADLTSRVPADIVLDCLFHKIMAIVTN